MEIPVKIQDHDPRTMIAMDIIREGIVLAQLLTGLSALEIAAVLGQVAGEAIGCVDATIEAREERADLIADGFVNLNKETLLKNFDYAYNEHRAIHERRECKVKPKPKIV